MENLASFASQAATCQECCNTWHLQVPTKMPNPLNVGHRVNQLEIKELKGKLIL
jgi:hypothetical protein